MSLVETFTCVRFPKRTIEPVYLQVRRTNHCQSATPGYTSKSSMKLNPYLINFWNPYVIVHELMHVLGFHHMHSYKQRDQHVKMIPENIFPTDFKK